VNGVICGGGLIEVKREPAGDRWCFAERKRLPHDWVLFDEPPERHPSYYDPVWQLECSGCGKDKTRFGSGW
jgi:hypothetical protein